MNTIKGKNIINIKPIGTQYHNKCVNVYDDKGAFYLMKVSEILKFNTDFNNVEFNIIRKRVHKYLEVK